MLSPALGPPRTTIHDCVININYFTHRHWNGWRRHCIGPVAPPNSEHNSACYTSRPQAPSACRDARPADSDDPVAPHSAGSSRCPPPARHAPAPPACAPVGFRWRASRQEPFGNQRTQYSKPIIGTSRPVRLQATDKYRSAVEHRAKNYWHIEKSVDCLLNGL
jgi:hypothetical protein